MGKRGRKSLASLSIISGNGVEVITRPKPPSELTDEQSSEWIGIVNRLPADWFTKENHILLIQYCRHIVASRRLSQLVEAEEKSEEFTLFRYDALLRMQSRESGTLMSLATKMRLAQQARYTTQNAGTKAKDAGTEEKPWDG